jgi:hypothetical protein
VLRGFAAYDPTVTIASRPTFSYGKPVPLPIEGIFVGGVHGRNYDIMPDGKRFVVIRPADALSDVNSTVNNRITVVMNWFEEVKGRVPTQ